MDDHMRYNSSVTEDSEDPFMETHLKRFTPRSGHFGHHRRMRSSHNPHQKHTTHQETERKGDGTTTDSAISLLKLQVYKHHIHRDIRLRTFDYGRAEVEREHHGEGIIESTF